MRRIVSIVVALVLTIGGAMTMIYLLLFAHGWKGVILVAAGFVTTMGAVWLYSDFIERHGSGDVGELP